MEVDSFRYLSPLISRYYKLSHVTKELPIPWTPLKKPLSRACFSLVTSGGLYHKGHDLPFDLEGERRNPPWGDPDYRSLPTDMEPSEVGVSHFHINAGDIIKDMNILLPITRFKELVKAGCIGSLAQHAYSFMGYQGFPADLSGWKEVSGPQVTQKLLFDGVDCVLLTSA